MNTNSLKKLIDCAIKTGAMIIRNDNEEKTIVQIKDVQFSVTDQFTEKDITSDAECREKAISVIEKTITGGLENASQADDKKTVSAPILSALIIGMLTDAYINPDNKLHLCVGFYENGEFKTNTIPGKKLADNIEYNRLFRPGRYYYVDGEYMCGGITGDLKAKIAEHKAVMKEWNLQPADHDTSPYE